MSVPAAIETKALTKRYRSFHAVDNVSLSIESGEVFGFLGPNGAGKTTTIKMLTSLLRPSSGSATVCGHDCVADSLAAKRCIGYMPDVAGFYGDMSALQVLAYYSAFYHLPAAERMTRARDMLQRLQLGGFETKKVKTYSRGMKQKLAFASAIIHSPSVVILDEPTIGLDPPTIHFFRTLIKELNEEGATIFLSSHILSEVEAMCHRVGIINQGKLVAVDDIDALRSRLTARQNRVVTVDVVAMTQPALTALRALPGVLAVDQQGTRLFITLEKASDAVPAIAKTLVHHDVGILSLATKEADLEDVFLDVVKGGGP